MVDLKIELPDDFLEEEVRCDYELDDEEKDLIKTLSQFTEVICQSAQERRDRCCAKRCGRNRQNTGKRGEGTSFG